MTMAYLGSQVYQETFPLILILILQFHDCCPTKIPSNAKEMPTTKASTWRSRQNFQMWLDSRYRKRDGTRWAVFQCPRAVLSSEMIPAGAPVSTWLPLCGRLYHIKVGHDNPTGEKESKEQAHESEFHSQANSYNLNTEDLVQTHIGPTFVASISVSSYVPCFLGSEGLALLCLPSPLAHRFLWLLFLQVPGALSGEGFDADIPVRLSPHIMSDCGPLLLFPTPARGSLSDDDQIKH